MEGISDESTGYPGPKGFVKYPNKKKKAKMVGHELSNILFARSQ